MLADTKEIIRLLQLQKIDIELLRLNKKLKELPQREAIMKLREKKSEISTKDEQVQSMLRESEHNLNRINDEDGRLALKQKEVQGKIDEAQGDYRAVTSLTKDLEGVAKRRKTLEADLDELGDKNIQIKKAKAQLEEALKTLGAQEDESIVSFQAEGGSLKNEVARLEALRATALADISDALVSIYEKKSKRYGGVAISKLEGGTCSVCRNRFDEGRFLQIKSEAPLSECPSCKRMMVIVDE